jgi:hypothetical protein
MLVNTSSEVTSQISTITFHFSTNYLLVYIQGFSSHITFLLISIECDF